MAPNDEAITRLWEEINRVEREAARKVRVDNLETAIGAVKTAATSLTTRVANLEDSFARDHLKLEYTDYKLEFATAKLEANVIKSENHLIDLTSSLIKFEATALDVNKFLGDLRAAEAGLMPEQLSARITAAQRRADEAYARAAAPDAPQRSAGPMERAGARVDSAVGGAKATAQQAMRALAETLGFRDSARRASQDAQRAFSGADRAAGSAARGLRDFATEVDRTERALRD